MSCTLDLIRQNQYAADSNPMVPVYEQILTTTTNAYDAGQTTACNTIMNAAGPYNALAEIINGINAKTQTLTSACVQESPDFKTATNKIKQLEGEINELSADEQTAKLRVELLRSRDVNVTNHQVFLLGRPLRPASIPLLWALSVLFIGIALLIFYMFNPFDLSPSNALLFQAYLFVRNPIFIGVALMVTTIAIILGTFYKMGVL